jgi:hypothetical protein
MKKAIVLLITAVLLNSAAQPRRSRRRIKILISPPLHKPSQTVFGFHHRGEFIGQTDRAPGVILSPGALESSGFAEISLN